MKPLKTIFKDFLGIMFSFFWADNYWYLLCKDLSTDLYITKISNWDSAVFKLTIWVIDNDHQYSSLVTSWGRKSSCVGQVLSGWNEHIDTRYLT